MFAFSMTSSSDMYTPNTPKPILTTNPLPPKANKDIVGLQLVDDNYYQTLSSRCSRQREWLSASVLSICSFVCLSVAKMQKTRFSQKLSNLELWCLLTTYIGSYVIGLFKDP